MPSKSIYSGPKVTDTASFIQKAKWRHGDIYDYSDVMYINSISKVTIHCKNHGRFDQQPNNHIYGQGCPVCGRSKAESFQRISQEEFINRSKQIHSNKYDYSKSWYSVGRSKVTIVCPIHGEFKQQPDVHLQGKGCKKCADVYRGSNRRYTTEEFISRSSKIHNNKFDYSKADYITQKSSVTIICPVHGEFQQMPSNHVRGAGCRQCASERNRAIKTLNPEVMYLPATLYHIEFTRSDGSTFEKIGVTTKSPKERFYSIAALGLTMRIIETKEALLVECIEMEEALFSHYEDIRYKVHDLKGTVVGGWTECFPPDIVSL